MFSNKQPVILLLMVFGILLATGCDVGSDDPPADQASRDKIEAEPARPYNDPSVEVIVTRDDTSLPSGCRPWQVAGLITTFFDAFNEGDEERLSRLFVKEFSTPPGLFGSGEGRGRKGFATYERRELLRYFAKRHEHGERMRLLKVDVAKTWEPGTAGVAYTISRRADDLEPESGSGGPWREAFGKGAIDCEKQRIFIWQMGTEPARENRFSVSPYDWPCDEPRRWTPGGAAIACARKD